MLITLEGLPYSGKKIQRKLLADALGKMGFQPITATSFTGWNKESSTIINTLATNGPGTPLEKLFLFLADQSGFMDRLVRPVFKYATGQYVDPRTNQPTNNNPAIICAGGPDSIIAFQGFGEKVASINKLAEMRDIALRGDLPDLTIYLDIHVDEMMARLPADEKPEVELKGPKYFSDVRDGFIEISNVEADRVQVVDADNTDQDIHEMIMDKVQHFLQERNRNRR